MLPGSISMYRYVSINTHKFYTAYELDTIPRIVGLVLLGYSFCYS